LELLQLLFVQLLLAQALLLPSIARTRSVYFLILVNIKV